MYQPKKARPVAKRRSTQLTLRPVHGFVAVSERRGRLSATIFFAAPQALISSVLLEIGPESLSGFFSFFQVSSALFDVCLKVGPGISAEDCVYEVVGWVEERTICSIRCCYSVHMYPTGILDAFQRSGTCVLTATQGTSRSVGVAQCRLLEIPPGWLGRAATTIRAAGGSDGTSGRRGGPGSRGRVDMRIQITPVPAPMLKMMKARS